MRDLLRFFALRAPSGPEAVAVFAEAEIDQGLQLLQQCLMNQPICHRGDTQLTLVFVRFGNHHLAYRVGPLSSCQQLLADVWPVREQQLNGLPDALPVHPGCAFVGLDPLPCSLQVQLHFTSLAVVSLREDLHLRRCVHAARTKK